MGQKRELMWWLAACVIGLLVAAVAAGGFIGPLMAVFIVLFLAGAVLLEVEGRDRTEPDVQAQVEDAAAGDEIAGANSGSDLPDSQTLDTETLSPEAADSLA